MMLFVFTVAVICIFVASMCLLAGLPVPPNDKDEDYDE